MAKSRIPRARALAGAQTRPTLASWLRRFRKAMAPGVHDALALAIGLWPLWVLTAGGMGLVWFMAMAQSP